MREVSRSYLAQLLQNYCMSGTKLWKERAALHTRTGQDIRQILVKAKNGIPPDRAELVYLLDAVDQSELEMIFQAARDLREMHFGNSIFLYGFVYFSTYCRNNCSFCYFRRSNKLSPRYRKSDQETIEAAAQLSGSGVHLIDLTMGEDPYYHRDDEGASRLAALISEIKSETGLPVMISPGVADLRMLEKLSAAGADWYACYQETHNHDIFSKLRLGQSYELRMASKRNARNAGMLIEEGLMTGIGETAQDIAMSIEMMRELQAHQIRVMSFVPQEGTTMADRPAAERIRELLTIALLRLSFPDRLIPASLDVDGLAGLEERMHAGANVITSLIPPQSGLAGVAQSDMDINEGLRSVQEVKPVLNRIGLKAASAEDYTRWVENERSILR